MNAILTGASGFLGQHIKTELEKRGHVVIPIHHKSLDSSPDILSHVDGKKIGIIVHCAGYGNHYQQNDEFEIIQANIIRTHNLLYAAKQLKPQAFVNISTSSVYGKSKYPMKEHNPLYTKSMYGATKVCGEFMSRAYADKYKLPVVTIRPFSVYGEGEADFRFIPTVVRSIIKKEVFPLDPLANHDWIYVKDFVRGVMIAIDYADKMRGEELNVGTGEQHTNKEIVDILAGFAGTKPHYTLSSRLRKYDIGNWTAHTKKLESFGYRQHYDIFEGLRRTYEYYVARYS